MTTHEHLKYRNGLELCPREGEALVLAALGHSTKESARIMGVAACTVKAYLDRAREKLNARNVAHAVSIAWENGLLASKYLCGLLFVLAVLHAAIGADIGQRNVGRLARGGRNGRRETGLALDYNGLDTPDTFEPLSAKQWRQLFRSAA